MPDKPRVMIGRPHFARLMPGRVPPGARDVRYVYDRSGVDPGVPIGLLWRVAGSDDDGTAGHYEWTPGTFAFPARKGMPAAASYQYVRTFRAWLGAHLAQEVEG